MIANPSIAVVGATGAVGREMLAVLAQRRFPHRSIRALASPKSAGQRLPFAGRDLVVEPLGDRSLEGIDIALFSAGSTVSKQYAPGAAETGTVVIDNSSAFRMNPRVPLVVPEVNPEALEPLRRHAAGGDRKGGIVANPNCTAIILLVALTPLRRAFGIERIVVSTYQAASGAGARGMEELESQTRAVIAGEPAVPRFFHEPYAFNLFSHNTAIDPATGLNVEEQKVIDETRKIWGDPSVRLAPTCIRVPVLRAHSESINVIFRRPATTRQVREALADARGVRIIDDRAANRFPTPQKASGGDEVLVGRIRPDPSCPGGSASDEEPSNAFNLFVCGDQLRKGAALNAVQIAEELLP
jgi:aspartate-semialdehyde dehydrogenase